MKERILNTVHALLERSGQSVPAKNLSTSTRSLEIYDVDHWPETFNTLLVHDFPSIVISIDSSTASLSGFVVSIQWNPPVDKSDCIRFSVHILFLCALIFYVACACSDNFERVSPESVEIIKGMYVGNSSSGVVSVLTDELRAVMTQGGF